MLHLISSLEQGGAERQLAELVRALDPARVAATLAVWQPIDHLGYALPVETVTLSALGGLSPLPAIVSLLRSRRFDLVHAWLGEGNRHARAAVRLTRASRLVTAVRVTQLPWREVLEERVTGAWSDAVVVNSRSIRDELVARAHADPARIAVIENGVDTARFAPLPDDAIADERRSRDLVGRLVLVMPGRLSAQKNQRAVLDALASLKRASRLPPSLCVVFAGRGSPPWYGATVRAQARALGLGDTVRFAGVVGPIERLVASADGVLLPSRYEGLPNAVLEALACGVPAVVSPPANEDALVTDGRDGIVTRGTSPDDIAEAITRFAALTPTERRAMGAAGRAGVASRFSLSQMVSRTVDLYERVMAAPSTTRPIWRST